MSQEERHNKPEDAAETPTSRPTYKCTDCGTTRWPNPVNEKCPATGNLHQWWIVNP